MAQKIALIHFAYFPNIGGVEILLKEHALMLTKLGYDVTVITGFGKSSPKDGVKVIEIPNLQSIHSFDPKLETEISHGNFNQDYFTLVDYLKKIMHQYFSQYDSLVVHNMMTFPHNLAFIEAFSQYTLSTNQSILIYTHDHKYIYNAQALDLNSAATSDREKKLLTTPLKNATYIAISKTFRIPLAKLLALPEEEIHVVPNAININRFLNIDDEMDNIFQKFGIYKKFPIILSPVNILERKNLVYALEVIANLKKQYHEIYYIISGTPSHHHESEKYFALLKEKIKSLELTENVLFLYTKINHVLSPQEMHSLYILSDAILYLSKSENFGLPIIESALTKTPIFVSNLEVFHEVGGNYLTYINPDTTSPSKTAEIINAYFQTYKYELLNHHVRSHYELTTVLEKYFIPLLKKN
ncbi:hypothetical protein A3A93_05505 [Candidatus Roizmanbacteria bacterium RIFCSPLOWO2_01_FULL_38_12]|uniref:Glycosyl transferase family 1 domain-containing protein n=1 Tax=Candidatus Roizmanbacteria bacterium RIFCSPLOWO2_01_FULL_38_12 TaxID=1802061 RepID=A0A1F7IZ50_9BACT|nr:MAG: hypothetical protein A2861_03725 [Candidatus Roizmanbacteria bacterium RIFCSPHIGHO2_01_FULL_38_15]OGK35246.1 MAG: hypothetical protein A3F59_06305 [Candidatus Roizmanbacteria bacterium RIFCSPHIGHO2_12_FULL_38_13]OGK48643.1 MAG: hypothetical protein A3A93_05505 [Candidatus Roizmanbacteria bacterium RIFCSPLOWO2_01_FULL_38_12]